VLSGSSTAPTAATASAPSAAATKTSKRADALALAAPGAIVSMGSGANQLGVVAQPPAA
jgi:hypothetical protein